MPTIHPELIDAEDEAQRHPTTFEIAPLSQRRNLQPGDDAKVCVGHRERFWVRVLSRFESADGSVVYHGEPEENGETEAGALLTFEPRHVYDYDPDDDNADDEPEGRSA